jgi:hypothetical protein
MGLRPMVLRGVVLASLVLSAAACGDKPDPPTAPSAARRALGMTIVVPGPTLGVGESVQLSAVIAYSDGTREPAANATWTTSQASVCALWAAGVAVALSPGPVTITATAGELTTAVSLTVEARAGATRRVQGVILDLASGAPVPSAPVRFDNFGGGAFLTTTSDASGRYAIDLPAVNVFANVPGGGGGWLRVRVGGPAFRGDVYANTGACLGRYGLVIDAVTFRPIAGATVHYGGGVAQTGADGWYRIDHPCVGSVSGNTITVQATHPDYEPAREFTGRGLSSMTRLDLEMRRP